jgi:AdoMet-dependent rRNA methyltransferase SPB1
MGKTRAYKHRLDKYYHLARSVGYRSRAAFKLVQLNQQYDFLSTAQYCLDLCAAPGGWSQVASKYMPVGSTIIAIDLAPIKPIPRVVTLQADITSAKTHTKVRKLMQANRADVVLNDGAPNVGAAWITDSTNQLDLCLASVKFATLFLRKGGWFVTKVFRSEHYNSLLYVLKQFFDDVIPTKPKASRDTSAELFVVCKGYRAPAEIDPRLLDSQYVFSDLDDLVKRPTIDVETVEKKAIDFRACGLTNFLKCREPMEVLATVNQIEFDDGALSVAAAAHPATTEEVRTLCRDLKVIGKADRRVLLRWRRTLRTALIAGAEPEAPEGPEASEAPPVADDEDTLDADAAAALEALRAKKRREERAGRRHTIKMRDQLIRRLQKNLAAPPAVADMLDPAVRFGKMHTPLIPETDTAGMSWEQIVEANLEYLEGLAGPPPPEKGDDGEVIGPLRFARHVEVPEPPEQPEDEDRQAAMWYSQSIFGQDEEYSASEDDPGTQAPERAEEEEAVREEPTTKEPPPAKKEEDLKGQGIKDFDAAAYAMAKKLLSGKRGKRELIDDSFNRYMHDDGPLPSWFAEDEKHHNRPMMPVTKDDVAEWRARMRAVNEVATKRVVEARARKKQKALQKMKNLQEKADEIAEKEGLDERSKLHILKQIYQKGMSKLDQPPKIVVAQKRDAGNPKYTKKSGERVKLVDKRMKKDLKGEKKAVERKAKAGFKKKKSKFIHRRK